MGHSRVDIVQPCCPQTGTAYAVESPLVQAGRAAPQGDEPPADGIDILPRDPSDRSPHADLPARPPSAEMRLSRRNLLDRASASRAGAGHDA